jgi:hypothetical protein
VHGLGELGLLLIGGASLAATIAVCAFAWVCWRARHSRPR